MATLIANGHTWSPAQPRRAVQRLESSSDDDDEQPSTEEGPAQASTADSGASTGAAEPEPTDKDQEGSDGKYLINICGELLPKYLTTVILDCFGFYFKIPLGHILDAVALLIK
jgi:hypothetical protein